MPWVTGCQLDFVLLITTLWAWCPASFPCSYLNCIKMIWLYGFFRQLCQKLFKIKVSYPLHSPHPPSRASLCRRLLGLSGAINPWNLPIHAGHALSLSCLSCFWIWWFGVFFPIKPCLLGLEHSQHQVILMRLYCFLKLCPKRKKETSTS